MSDPSKAEASPPLSAPILAALEMMPSVVALYDQDDYLRHCNQAYRDMFLRGLALPVHFTDVLRHGFHHGFGVKIDCGDVEQFIADVMKRRRSVPQRSIETDTVDGRWLLITETLMPNGWLLSIGADITRIKNALGAKASAAVPILPQRRVLVIDDNAMVADALARLVTSLGQIVRRAHDGPSALQVAADFHPEVIILDIEMPGMLGLDVVRELRRLPGGRNARIVAHTGHGSEEFEAAARGAGFDAFITKPIDRDALADILRRAPKIPGPHGVL